MEFALRSGHVVLIDAVDSWLFSACSWHVNSHGYVVGGFHSRTRGTDRKFKLHRAIFCFPLGGLQVDHRNGNRLDNRRSNLRIATHAENQRNKHVVKAVSGFKGVVKKRSGCFVAKIGVSGKRLHLGTFPTAIDAAHAYDAAALHHFGEFAATNASLGLLTNT